MSLRLDGVVRRHAPYKHWTEEELLTLLARYKPLVLTKKMLAREMGYSLTRIEQLICQARKLGSVHGPR